MNIRDRKGDKDNKESNFDYEKQVENSRREGKKNIFIIIIRKRCSCE